MSIDLLAQLGESYFTAASLWSLVGFASGYLVGRAHHRLTRKKDDDRDRD